MKIMGLGIPELIILLIPLVIIVVVVFVVVLAVTKKGSSGNAQQPQSQTTPADQSAHGLEELMSLHELVKSGVITQEEFDERKAALLKK